MEQFNIIIGTHGRFGEELVKSAEMIAGDMSHVSCVSLYPNESLIEYMEKATAELESKKGYTIVLVDLYGGTPCNAFTALCEKKYGFQVLTGLNLGLLIELNMKLTFADEINEEELIAQCQEVVRNSCVHTNQVLGKNE